MFNKELVKKNFTNCLNTYNQSAIVQKMMAEKLVALMIDNKLEKFNKVLEVGVGTGLLTKIVKNNIEVDSYFVNDMIHGYHKYIYQIDSRINFLDGDIEEICIGSGYDVVLANAVFQWIQDTDKFVSKIRAALCADGFFIFSTFGENNFLEIKDVFGISLDYFNVNLLEKIIGKEFKIMKIETQKELLFFDNLYEVLTHCKRTGTNNLKVPRLTKGSLAFKEDMYKKKYSVNGKITLTYEPIWMLCKAK